MKRWFLACVALLLASTPARAQIDLGSASITAASSGGACTAVRAGCAEFFLPNAGISSITLQITGTFSQTLLLEGTSAADPATGTWFTISATKLSDGSYTTAPTTGQYAIPNSGLTGVRVRCTSFISGTAVVAAVRGYAFARTLTPFFSVLNVGTGILNADGSCTAGAVPYSFTSDTDTGLYRIGADNVGACAGGTQRWDYNTTRLNLSSGYALQFNGGANLIDDAANTVGLRNGTNAQFFNVYATSANSNVDKEYTRIGYDGSEFVVQTLKGGTGTGRDLWLGTVNGGKIVLQAGTGTTIWHVTSAGLLAATDNGATIGATSANRPSSLFLAGPAITPAASVAAGGTVNNSGDHTRQRYQITIAPASGDCSTAFIAGSTTADCTIATLPAGMQLQKAYADVTVGFTCSGTCTGTKVMQCGITGAGTEILAAGFNVAATGQAGDVDAELGSAMTRAAAIQGGYLPSWSSTTPVVCRFTSGTGNWGSGAATFVNAGSVKITLITEQIK